MHIHNISWIISITGEVKPVLFLSQPKCLTNLTWLRFPVSTRQSWRRQRQKKKTLCPPKRVSVPLRVSEKLFVKPSSLYPLKQFSCQCLLIPSTAVKRLHALQQIATCCNISNHWHTANQKKSAIHSHAHYTSLLTNTLFFSSFPAIEQERKGDATPWLLSTWRKEAEMPQKKALSFDYHSIWISCFVFRKGCSWAPGGCYNGIWHPHMGALLPHWV